ncbi:hypothetical protein pipiens_010905, partial [Culex pipiens pipiens]
MASPLEHYVNHVRTMSSAGNFRELVEYLLESTELLAKNGNILDNVLETLDIQQHSLGVLFVLVIKFSEPNLTKEKLIKVVLEPKPRLKPVAGSSQTEATGDQADAAAAGVPEVSAAEMAAWLEKDGEA